MEKEEIILTVSKDLLIAMIEKGMVNFDNLNEMFPKVAATVGAAYVDASRRKTDKDKKVS